MKKTYLHTELAQADNTLNHILNIIVEGVWDWNANTGHVKRSPSWYKMLDYEVSTSRENVFNWENIIHPFDYSMVMNHFEAYINGDIDHYEIEYRCLKNDGSYLWIIDRGKIISRNEDGSVARMIGAHHNIHKQKCAQLDLLQKNKLLRKGNATLENAIRLKADELAEKNRLLEKQIAEIEYISNIDPLTQIANRKKFEKELEKEVLRANRYHHPLSLVLFDIDFFKQINDKHGHKKGDKVLHAISQVVSENIRDVDLFARWGGDEFVIIFPELSLENANRTCQKIMQKFIQNELLKKLSVTCSFGVVQYQQSEPRDTLFQRADKLLFMAKEHGRNQVCSINNETK